MPDFSVRFPYLKRGNLAGPKWAGYPIALVSTFVLTAGLQWLGTYLPLKSYPLPYILLMMWISYLFGTGPAIMTFILGLFLFDYFFVPPYHTLFPHRETLAGWAAMVTFLLGTLTVGTATIRMRSYRDRLETARHELEHQMLLLNTFAQNVPVGLEFVTPDMRLTFANRAAARLIRSSVDAMLNKHVLEALPPDIAAKAVAANQHVLDSGETVSWEDVPVVLDDGFHYFDIERVPVRSPGGDIAGVGIIIIETTEDVQRREALRHTYEREHHIAETLQASMLPDILQSFNGFKMETLYRAALDEARVGGDFYDVFPISDTKCVVVIGDVSGKGIKAASQVATARNTIRCWSREGLEPAEILGRTNETLIQDLDSEAFVTIFVGVLDSENGILAYANGGHSPALHWVSASNQAAILESTGPVVGKFNDVVFEERRLDMHTGDEILLGTDGIYEVRCAGTYLDIEDLVRVYAEMKMTGAGSADDLLELMMDACEGRMRDDVAILRIWSDKD